MFTKMIEYNLKGTYEPGSLDEVVGEINATEEGNFSRNKMEIDYYLNMVPLPILVTVAGVSGVTAVMEIYNIFSILYGAIQ